MWKRRGVRGLAQARDLYTLIGDNGVVEAEFEKFVGQELESPAYVAIGRLVAGSQLTRDHWRTLSRFAILQDLRTPLNYMEAKRRWERDIPAAFENVVRELPATLAESVTKGPIGDEQPPMPNPFAEAIRLKIEPPNDVHPDEAQVEVSISSGRRLWIASMRHLLTTTADRIIPTLKWSVAAPADGMEWPLTDHPMVRLNYYGPGRYDFNGGWGRAGTELMLPVSPRHLLYAQVGTRHSPRFTFTAADTKIVRRVLVERAFRWVYLSARADWVPEVRPREVDSARFAEEQRALRAWHAVHAEREREFLGDG